MQGLRQLNSERWLERTLGVVEKNRRIAEERGLIEGAEVRICYLSTGPDGKMFGLSISREVLTISRVDLKGGNVFFTHNRQGGGNLAVIGNVVRADRLKALIGTIAGLSRVPGVQDPVRTQ